jgi:hypothetical protein
MWTGLPAHDRHRHYATKQECQEEGVKNKSEIHTAARTVNNSQMQ